MRKRYIKMSAEKEIGYFWRQNKLSKHPFLVIVAYSDSFSNVCAADPSTSGVHFYIKDRALVWSFENW